MTMTDPVSDLLTRIRNASGARHETVDIPSSQLKLEIARILKEEGYISNYQPCSGQQAGDDSHSAPLCGGKESGNFVS